MKLATFTATDGVPELGVVQGAYMRSLSRAAPSLARDMIDLIGRWDEVEGDVRRLAASDAGPDIALDAVRLLAPVGRPGKIMAIGLNYADHIAESGLKAPEEQVWFTKAVTAVNAPFGVIQLPAVSKTTDYEVELVAIVGRGGRHIHRDEAASALFGYCVGNDVSERAWQLNTPQWSLGKSFDSHAPFGPWITTVDEIEPHGRAIRCLINGETRQKSDTRHLVFDVWAQVEHLSKAMTLEPGDVIFTGTPSGVGAAMTPPKYLKSGDVVRCEIEGLGHLEHTCADE